ncbi:SDR family NAD(P)-dependent oxidoreductase [Zavarzinia sp. CC-PAN008]|uniref:SDR family NAD(P)-dependent oxidoreductase n=1 Tax=Zavarzinia sp. CC-PAN008 TaxID=3243332 RepID=UPI003F745AB0
MAYQPFDLTGKVVVVTGGNSGIGLGMAEALAQSGAAVSIWGTNAKKNGEAGETLKAIGNPVQVLQVDVGDEKAVVKAYEDVVAQFGRVDSSFANAGMGLAEKSFLDITAENWEKVMRVNMAGAFYTLREGARHIINGGSGGSLAVTASLAAIEGAARNQHYGATKGGVISMIKGIAVEMGRHKIRANAILPGWIETAMTDRSFNNERFANAVLPRVPIRRWGQPEDFGGIAVYLASDASKYHTGDTFLIDGGYAIF